MSDSFIGEKKSQIQIKGIRDGLLVTLGEGDWSEIQAALLVQIEEKENFFKGARIALEVGNRILHAAELGGLRDKLSERGIQLWAVLSNSPRTEQTAQTLGMATRIFTPKADRVVRPASAHSNPEGENAILVHRTLRSGMRVEHSGNVIVLGDVNPGAEIVAGGNIIVWGRLKGSAYAGSEGSEKAMICAIEIATPQIRIGNFGLSVYNHKRKTQPEVAHLEDQKVVISPWDYRKEGGK